MKRRIGIRSTVIAGLAAIGMAASAQPAAAQSIGDVLEDTARDVVNQSIRGIGDEIFQSGQESRDYNRAVRACARLGQVPEFDRRGQSTTTTRNSNRSGSRNTTTIDYGRYTCVWPEDHSSNQRRGHSGYDGRYSDVDRYYSQRRLDTVRARSGVDDPLLRAELRELENRRLDIEERRVENRVPDTTIEVRTAPAPTQSQLTVTEQEFIELQRICVNASTRSNPDRPYNVIVSDCNARISYSHKIGR